MRYLIPAACLLVLTACAADKPTVVASAADTAPAPAAAASAPKRVCHAQQVTGSHFTQTVCEDTQQDNTRTQDAARSWVEQNQRVVPSDRTSATH